MKQLLAVMLIATMLFSGIPNTVAYAEEGVSSSADINITAEDVNIDNEDTNDISSSAINALGEEETSFLPPGKAAFKVLLEEYNALDEFDYGRVQWTNYKNAIDALIPIYEQSDSEDITESQISNINNLKSKLIFIDVSYDPITLADGYYLLPLKKSVQPPYAGSESISSNLVQSTAILRVENGEAYVTMRIGGATNIKSVFVGTSECYKLAAGNRVPPLGTDNVPVGLDDSIYEAWRAAGHLKAENNIYWDRSVTTEVDTTLSHIDANFKLENVSENIILQYYSTSSATAVGTGYNLYTFVDFSELLAIALPDIENIGDGEFIWDYDMSDVFRGSSSSKYNTNKHNEAQYNIVKDSINSDINVTVQEGVITAKIKWTNASDISYFKEKISGSGSTTSYNLNGDIPTDYQEVPIDEHGESTLVFPLDYKSLVFGKQLMVHPVSLTAAQNYFFALYLRPGQAEPVVVRDDSSDIEYHSDSYNIPGNSQLRVRKITAGEDAYKATAPYFDNVVRKWELWNIKLKNAEDKDINPLLPGKLYIPIPDGWDKDNIELKYHNTRSEYVRANGSVIGDYYIADVKVSDKSATGSYILYENKVYINGDNLSNGTYDVDINIWHCIDDGPSMANAAVNKPSKLVVKDGKQTLYLSFGPVHIGDLEGYLSHMWYYGAGTTVSQYGWPVGEQILVKVSEFYKDNKGQYVFDDIKGRIAYHPHKIYFELPTTNWENYVRFQVPVMDSMNNAGNPAPQDARLRIDYGGAVKISNETPEPPAEEIIQTEQVDKTALATSLTTAKAVTQGKKTDSAWQNLQTAIDDAQTVYDSVEATQEQTDNAKNELIAAVDSFKVSPDKTEGLDKNNLADGTYTLNADMIQLNRSSQSMANSAIDHKVTLTVIGGLYYLAVDFKGLTVGNDLGYLSRLKYYGAGYTFGQYGAPQGTLIPSSVLSWQTDSKGAYIVDSYNDKDNPYPKRLQFPLVNKANYEDDFVPLQVFVPIMESITAGSGTQDVLMRLDWTSLKEGSGTGGDNGGGDEGTGGGDNGQNEVVKTALSAKLAQAKAIAKGDYTDASYQTLQNAINAAQAVVNSQSATQSEVNNQITILQNAINGLTLKPVDNTNLNKDNLADGTYKLHADMVQINRTSLSMSNNAINHDVTLSVIGGKYFIAVDFKGLTIGSDLGYLSRLKYYGAGFTYDSYGAPKGTIIPASVLSWQKDGSGAYIVDTYNDKDNPYPKRLQFPLVNKATYEGNFVPLQVYVPIMESITAGSGTQDVLMRLDWTTLKTGTPTNDDENEQPGEDDGKNEDNGTGTDEQAKTVKTALTAKIKEAKAIQKGNYTDVSYQILQTAITVAQGVADSKYSTQSEINEQVKALTNAINGLALRPETTVNKDNVKDGKYEVRVDLWHATQDKASMGNGSLNHTALIEVNGDKLTMSVSVHPMQVGTITASLASLQIKQANGSYVFAEVIARKIAGNKPSAFRFVLPSKDTYISVKVDPQVPVMGDEPVDARLRISWDTLTKVSDDTTVSSNTTLTTGSADAVISKDQNLSDPESGIKVEAGENVLPDGTTLKVTPITSGADYDKASKALDGVLEKFFLYDITLIGPDGEIVQPTGKVKITVPLPEGYDASKILIFRVNPDGTKTLIEGTIEDGNAIFNVNHFSLYAIGEKAAEKTALAQAVDNTVKSIKDVAAPLTDGSSGMSLLWLLIPIALIAGLAAVFIIRRKLNMENIQAVSVK
jgi:heme-binding NEAT domain protein